MLLKVRRGSRLTDPHPNSSSPSTSFLACKVSVPTALSAGLKVRALKKPVKAQASARPVSSFASRALKRYHKVPSGLSFHFRPPGEL